MLQVFVLAVVQVECGEDQGGELPVGLRAGVVLVLFPVGHSLRLLDRAQNVTDVYLTFHEEALQIRKRLKFKMQALLLNCGRSI